jgi:hypothetical protein
MATTLTGSKTSKVWYKISEYNNTTEVYNVQISWSYVVTRESNTTKITVNSITFNQLLTNSGWGVAGCTVYQGAGWSTDNNYTGNTQTVVSGTVAWTTTVNKNRTFTNEANGNCNAYIQWWCQVSGSDSHRPNFYDWQTYSLSTDCPSNTRAQPVSTSTITNITSTGCTINFSGTCSSYNSLSEYCYRIDSGSDVYSTATTATVDGLTASTSYKFHLWVKDNAGWWSEDNPVTITTTNPLPKIKISDSWKTASNMYIKISGSWKKVTKVYVKVGGAWKLSN